MSIPASDPRAKLKSLGNNTPPVSSFGDASYAKYYQTAPQVSAQGERSWVARGQNFVVAYSEVAAGATLERREQLDEYFLLLPDPASTVRIVTDGEDVEVRGHAVAVLPPGRSAITSASDTVLVRFLTSRAADLTEIASNAATYASPAPNVAPLEDGPAPSGGYRVRRYGLDVPDEQGRFGRIWRSQSLMVNYSAPRPGPRDVTRMSPHSHSDFEQGSLCLSGTFVHHLRWPWGTDQRLWREDTHEICAGQSLTVIPSLVVHTSQQCGTGINQLVDLFAPPRADFLEQPGWVLNAGEYPESGQ